MLRRTAFLAAVCLAAAGHMCAQSRSPSAPPPTAVKRLPVLDRQDIRFIRLAYAGEAVNRWVPSIVQDNQGFIWFASNAGLFRYDGYSLQQFRHDPANPNTVASDNIRTLFKDRSGILWIGTVADGLDRFDPARGSFTHYRHQPGVEESLGADGFGAIYQDRLGTLWFGTMGGGLQRLDPRSGTFVRYKRDPNDSASLSSDYVTALYEDRRGNFWVGTTQGLNLFDRATGHAVRFMHDLKNPRSLQHDYVSALLEDHNGILWVGSSFGDGLCAFDGNTRDFTRHSIHSDPRSSEAVSGVTSIHEDAAGVLWLGTVEDGLFALGRDRARFVRYSATLADPRSLHDNSVIAIFEDAEGVMWLGTPTGISHFVRSPSAFENYRATLAEPHGLRDNLIWSVQGDSQGSLWIGTARGLHRLDRATGHFAYYRHQPGAPYSLSHDTVSAIREDASGKLWFGTYGGGLNAFDRATGRFYPYRHDSANPGSLSSDLVLCLLVDHEGTLWVGTQGGELDRFDPRTGRFTNFLHDSTGSQPRGVTVMFEDRAGALWLGTHSGLMRFDRKTAQFTLVPSDTVAPEGRQAPAIRSIFEDSRGTLWVGKQDGLYRLDRSTGAVRKFTMRDGLPDDCVAAILEARNGDLWLGTHYGLSAFSPRLGRFRNYSELDGLPGNNFNYYGMESACLTPHGEMVFGSTDGLTLFDPDRIAPNPYVPPVVLTDFLLFNKPAPPGQGSPLSQPISATTSLTLDDDLDIVSLEFAALSYSAPRRNRYRYMLEGLDHGWNEVDSTRRLATYTNLPAGHYVFRVQGSNNDQLWNEAGVRLAITVLPPWWKTLWFRTLALLLLIALILSAFRMRMNALRRQERRLVALVDQRTLEAVQARDEAQAANRAKSAFLANMSHELRTPLNAILGFSSLLRDSAVSEQQRTQLDIINRSGEHLLNLIDDVLDLAKIEAGKQELAIEPCDLFALVREITQTMHIRADARGLALLSFRTSEFPRFVRTDAPKLRQVLYNLLGNAIKFTPQGTVTLRLGATPAADAGSVRLRFEVEDTGIGIAQQDLARIFDPFTQAGKSAAQQGTGLGLSISRRFVEMLGGTLAVESQLGRGSKFTVELPSAIAQESEVTGVEAPPEHLFTLEPGQPECRVLIVEDYPENATLLHQLLTDAGFQVSIAESGALAIEAFAQCRPHFIWMDLRMPGMSGTEATRHIREMDGGQDAKIVAMTASVMASQRAEVLASGMDGFLSKPFHRDEVFECMGRLLGLRYRQTIVPAGEAVGEAAEMRPEALAALPAGLRKELADAVISLNRNRISDAIDRVAEHDATLASALRRLADQFAYTALLKAIARAESEPALASPLGSDQAML